MASCVFKAKVQSKLLGHFIRGAISHKHKYGAHRNLMNIAWNGETGFPAPSTLPLHNTYKHEEHTINLQTLKEKEKHDWKLLTMEEKRRLYDISVHQPYCDVLIAEDEWKPILGGAFVAMGLMTFGIYLWLANFAYAEHANKILSPRKGIEGTELMLDFVAEEKGISFNSSMRH